MEQKERERREMKKIGGPMPREVSLGSIMAFAGTSGSLYERTIKGELKDCERKFQTGTACTGNEIEQFFFGMRNTVPIFHSPSGCPQWLVFLNMIVVNSQVYAGLPPDGLTYVSTDLTSSEIVYGGEKRLKEVILWVDKHYNPDLIPIYEMCAAGTVGDDIEGVIEDVKDKVKAILMPLHCGGFRSQLWASAFDFGAFPLVYQIMEEPRKREDDLINIPIPWTCMPVEMAEMKRVLGRLGLRVRYYPRNATVEDVRRAPEAAGNMMYCVTFGYPWCAYMKQRFGTPYEEEITQNIGIKCGSDWLRAAARLTGREDIVDKIIEEEEAILNKKIKPVKEKLKGKRVFISGSHARGPAIARLCAEIGMEVVGLAIYHWDKLSAPILKEFIDIAGPDVPTYVGDLQMQEQAVLFEKFKPDLYFGDAGEVEAALRLGIPAMPIQTTDLRGAHSLFSGAYNFAKEMSLLLEYPTFAHKLLKHSKLMFKKSWVANEANAYKFIPEENIAF